MNWYGGNIAEAVQRSKQEGAVFFVAIFGEDDTSRKLEDAVNSGEIQSVLSNGKYVCIRLSADSQEHLQFKQIYSNAESPCLYFISLMGAPVEIVHGEVATEELRERCASAWSKHSKVIQVQKAPPQAQAQPSPPQSIPQNSAPPSTETASSQPGNSSQVPATSGSRENTPSLEELENDASNENLTLDQKIERARQLAAARAKLKLEEEAEETRRREKERREAGKGMAELKRWQEEQEAKRMIEERKREKQEEQALRQKLREQIAQDRAERNKRTNASLVYEGGEPSTSSGTQKPSVTTSNPANYTGKARLQFRMPDGSSQNHTFEKDVTLGHVHQFLKDGQYVKFSNFNLCVAFPRREFTSTEYQQSLGELGLLPSAALLVIPIGGGKSFGASTGGGGAGIWALITTLIGYLLYPVTYLFGMMQRSLPSSGGSGSPTPSTSAAAQAGNRGENRLGGSGSGSARPGNLGRPTAGPSSGSAEDVRKRNINTDRKSDGNIHRLRNQETDSDDELGTWNGNSTQQKPR